MDVAGDLALAIDDRAKVGAMDFQLKAIEESIVDLEFSGCLNSSYAGDLAVEVRALLNLDSNAVWLLADMRQVTFVDSSGVNQLLRLRRQFREAGGQFALHSLTPAVGSIFEVLRLNDLLNISGSRDAALDRIVSTASDLR